MHHTSIAQYFNSKLKLKFKGVILRIDIIIVQLGSPQTATYFEIRRYLRDFLKNERVVKIDGSILLKIIWILVLYLFILIFRPFKLLSAYNSLIDSGQGEMPLIKFFNIFIERLKQQINEKKTTKNEPDSINIYGAYVLSKPTLKQILQYIQKSNNNSLSRLFLIPHYPIYSEATNALIFDEFYKAAKNLALNLNFEFNFIGSYHKEKCYINCTVKIIDEYINEKQKEGILIDYLIISYHGMPVKTALQYKKDVQETFLLIKEKISSMKNRNNKNQDNIFFAFQSKFGIDEWTKPYLEDLINELCYKDCSNNNLMEKPKSIKIAIATPSFLVDCLETIYEIDTKLKNKLALKGIEIYAIPSLNFRDDWINAYADFLLSLASCKCEKAHLHL